MYEAHQHQQFINNERNDDTELEHLKLLTRYADNYILVQPALD